MPMTSRRSPSGHQRGAALLMAMVIVTLVATLASSMVWQQWRAVQVEGAERVRSQASWVLTGALDWARLILREDKRGDPYDHLGEPWAIPLAEARLSTFLASDTNNNSADNDDAPEAFLSGKVDDATARYNLRNVLGADGELIPDEDAVSPLDVVADRMRREQIEHVLASLDGREQRVLRLRFGLDDGHARTLEEVGREFGLTRERIRQIEVQALRKLRHPSRSRKLREFAA